jgi:hypothetical protein
MADRAPLAEVLQEALDARAAEIRTALPAVVVSYDRVVQRANVRPAVWPQGEEQPILENVRCVFPRGGGGYLHFQVAAGEAGILIACEADIQAWLRTGEVGPAPDVARHHLQNAIFLPGIAVDGSELSPAPPVSGVVLEGAGDLRLGTGAATEPPLGGNLMVTAVTNLAQAVNVWSLAHAVWTAAIVGFIPGLAPAKATIDAATTVLVNAFFSFVTETQNARSTTVTVQIT